MGLKLWNISKAFYEDLDSKTPSIYGRYSSKFALE